MRTIRQFTLLLASAFSLAGCKSRQEELLEERAAVESQRQSYQRILDQHPVGSRFATSPDAMLLQGHHDMEAARIRAIDRELGR